ncbi:hydrolase [Chelonobacter oris]|uniref:Cof-type HAD-IIB family hydrolase n=1 Tax=Chelonobacter oris TaxID=505317 RepID=UPI00244CEFDE|nr:Cof-type HAD-IIB family hydrolase [Chelonobacter oris]MDH2999723.1 hydrolase [Chelonobacter oris]
MLDPQQVKIVFFDIDETLYMKHQQHLPSSVPTALAKLRQNGIIPAIATGRSLCALPKQIKQLIGALPIDLFVTINGQYNSYRGQPLQTYPLSRVDIERLVGFFKQYGIDYAFVSEDAVALNRVTADIAAAMDPITTDYIVDEDYYLTHAVYQMLPFYSASQDRPVAESGVLQQHLRVVRWHDFSVDLLSAEGSKARGIRAVLQHFNLKPENAVAFGDGLNDLEMLREVGFGVAMGNAHPELKAVADYVTSDIADDGLSYGLHRLGLID